MSHLSPKWIEALKKYADRETWTENDEFDPCSFFGGNYEDTYLDGLADGRTELAREILLALEKN